MDNKKFKKCQESLGLKNHEMAKALGVGVRTVIHWRVGDRKVPGPVWILLAIYSRWPKILEWALTREKGGKNAGMEHGMERRKTMEIRRNVQEITLRRGEYATNLKPKVCLDVIVILTEPLPDKTQEVVVKLPVYPYSSSKAFELPQVRKKIKALFGEVNVIDEKDIPTLKPSNLKEVIIKRNNTGWYISF